MVTALPLDIGLKLPTSGPFADVATLRSLTLTCETLDYHSVWVSDRTHWTVADAPRHFGSGAVEAWTPPIVPNYYEPLTMLAYLAGITERLVLGTSILVVSMRNPVLLGKQIACLDQLADGRLILGIGVGNGSYAPAELSATGQLERLGRRGRLTDEWIDVMRCIWANSSCAYEGEFIQIPAASIYPKPVQPGGPPVWIAGASEAARRRVVARGDGWFMSHLRPSDARAKVDTLHALATKAGRDPQSLRISHEIWLSIDPSGRRARDAAAMTLSALNDQRSVPDVDLADLNLIGSPAEIVSKVAAYRDAGVDHLVLRVIGGSLAQIQDSLHMFAEMVMLPLRHT